MKELGQELAQLRRDQMEQKSTFSKMKRHLKTSQIRLLNDPQQSAKSKRRDSSMGDKDDDEASFNYGGKRGSIDSRVAATAAAGVERPRNVNGMARSSS